MIIKPLECVYCNEKETTDHLFFKCIVAQNMWKFFNNFFHVGIGHDLVSVASLWLNCKNSALNTVSSAILWCLWNDRNAMIFDNKNWLSLYQVWRSVLRTIRYWLVLSQESSKGVIESFAQKLEEMIRSPQLIQCG